MPQADTWGAFLVCLFRQQGKGKFGGRKRCGNCRSCGKTKERFSHSSLNLRFTVPTTPTAAGPSSNTTFLLLPIADELILSFVPDGEQRIWRSLTRMKVQLTRDRVRLQNQMECLLEEMRIKLSIVVSNLLGASGLRILHALAQGETDAKKLAELGDERLHCTEEQLVDALTGRVQPSIGECWAYNCSDCSCSISKWLSSTS